MDIFHEQLVKHHRTAGDYVKIVGIIVGALLLFLILVVAVPVLVGSAVGMLSSICLLVGVAVLFCAYYLIVNTGIEYEYILTNNDLDIDKIIGKRKRRRLLTVKVNTFEDFGIYRPEDIGSGVTPAPSSVAASAPAPGTPTTPCLNTLPSAKPC